LSPRSCRQPSAAGHATRSTAISGHDVDRRRTPPVTAVGHSAGNGSRCTDVRWAWRLDDEPFPVGAASRWLLAAGRATPVRTLTLRVNATPDVRGDSSDTGSRSRRLDKDRKPDVGRQAEIGRRPEVDRLIGRKSGYRTYVANRSRTDRRPEVGRYPQVGRQQPNLGH